MNRKTLFPMLMFAGILASCSTDPVKSMVTEYLKADLGNGVKVIEMHKPEPWTSDDSLKVLEAEFDTKKADRVEQLNSAIESAEAAVEAGEKVMNSGFSALADQAELTVLEAKSTLVGAQIELASLDLDCKGTTLEGLYNRMQVLESENNEVMYNILRGKAKRDSGEEVPFDLIANEDLTAILGAYGE